MLLCKNSCFTKLMLCLFQAMSNALKKIPKKEQELPNIKTRPTNTRGAGYTDIGLSKFPSYMYVTSLFRFMNCISNCKNIHG